MTARRRHQETIGLTDHEAHFDVHAGREIQGAGRQIEACTKGARGSGGLREDRDLGRLDPLVSHVNGSLLELADLHDDALRNRRIDPKVAQRQAGHQGRAGTHGFAHLHETLRDDAAIGRADLRITNALASRSNPSLRGGQAGGGRIAVRRCLI